MPIFANTADFNTTLDTIRKWTDDATLSLPQFTRPALIESPMFIDSALIDEDIINDVIKSLYNIYIGYILTALQMNRYVTGNRTVRDMTSVVSTGSYLSSANEEIYLRNEDLINDFGKINKNKKKSKFDKVALEAAKENKMYDAPKNLTIAGGRIVDVFLNNPSRAGRNDKEIKLSLFIKFNPRFINENIIKYVITANFQPSFMRRILQLRAGEIKFFRDFIFQIDQVETRAKALKEDKDNSISDIFRNQRKSFTRAVFKLLRLNSSANIFNSVLIFEKDRFDDFAHNAGLNFKDYQKRQKFFNSTASLFVVLIDPKYSLVEMYTNGIPSYGEYSYRGVKSVGNSDKMDIAEIMNILQKNQLPKF